MGERSGIEWTDSTWNPMRGCERISPGCLNCYAERHAGRFSGEGQPWEGYATLTEDGARWTRKVALVPEKLLIPLSWRKGRRIFVNAMSDTFHEALTDADIDKVFAVMLLAPRHTFQVLTKRSERMARYFAEPLRREKILDAARKINWDTGKGDTWETALNCAEDFLDKSKPLPRRIWLGVSVESQEYAARIFDILETPAVVRFVSAEPLLGRVNLRGIKAPSGSAAHADGWRLDVLKGLRWREGAPLAKVFKGLDWVIVGGESGAHARPMRLEWAREIVADCRKTGVPVFMKQLGTHPQVGYYDESARHLYDEGGHDWPMPVGWGKGDGQPGDGKGGRPDDVVELHVSKKGGDPAEWPEELRVQEFPK